MKKILFLLLCTVSMYGQTLQNSTFGNTTTNTIKVKTNTTSTTALDVGVLETDGSLNKMTPTNLPIPQVPLNYSVLTPNIGGHLSGIDLKLGALSGTTAGISTRVWFTADQTTITAGTFDLTNATSKGTVASHQQTVANDDGQKKYFTTDLIGQPFAMVTTFPSGTYAGSLSASTTPTNANQKFTIELYRCNNAGTPIASGVTGAVTGSLGVTVIMIMDSGEVTLANASITNVPVSTNLGAGGFTIQAGERIRYHVSAEKVGTAGGVINESVYYGSSYNSFIDVPVIYNSTSIKDVSTVTNGTGTVTDALNTLKSAIPVVYSTVVYVNATNPNSATIFDDVNPPVVNDNSLKANVNNLYVANDNSGWVYNSTSLNYVTKPTTASGSNFYLAGTLIDAGTDKVADIERVGAIQNPILSGNVRIKDNPVGSTPNKLIQTMAGTNNDYWAIYGSDAGGDKGIMIFEVGDNGEPISATGQKFQFKYTATSSGVAKTPFEIDYNLITSLNTISAPMYRTDNVNNGKYQIWNSDVVNAGVRNWGIATDALVFGDFTIQQSPSQGTAPSLNRLYIDNLGKVRVFDLAGTGDASVGVHSDGTLYRAAVQPLKYVALLSQSGTSAPTATVLENTLGGTVVWTRTVSGQFTATLTGAFTLTKTVGFFQFNSFTSPSNTYTSSFINTNVNSIDLRTSINGTLSDTFIGQLEIRVYP